jgi:hypothetical protein
LPGLRSAFNSFICDFIAALRDIFAVYEEPDVPSPPVEDNIHPEVVENCLWLYEHTLDSRLAIEDKAKSTFGVVSTLWPLFSAGLVFLLAHKDGAGITWVTSVFLIVVAVIFLALGFLWTSRTSAIKRVQVLGVDSVISKEGFRKYSAGFRAAGLIYCTSWNLAMNARYAQFVRQAQAMVFSGVFFAFLASIPLAILYSQSSTAENSSSEKMISSISAAINDQTRELSKVIKQASVSGEDLNLLRGELVVLRGRIIELEKKAPNDGGRRRPAKSGVRN